MKKNNYKEVYKNELKGLLENFNDTLQKNPELLKDMNFLKEAVLICPHIMHLVDVQLRDNKELALLALSYKGHAYIDLSDRLKNDEDIVQAFLKVTPKFQYELFMNSLRDIKVLALKVLEQSEKNIKMLSNNLKNDEDIIKKCVERDGLLLYQASGRLKNNKSVVKVAITNNSSAYHYISSELKKDKELAIFTLKDNPYLLAYVDESLKSDKDVVMFAISIEEECIFFADKELQNDKEILYFWENCCIKQCVKTRFDDFPDSMKVKYQHKFNLIEKYRLEDELSNVMDNKKEVKSKIHKF
jgi:hypothetical protein